MKEAIELKIKNPQARTTYDAFGFPEERTDHVSNLIIQLVKEIFQENKFDEPNGIIKLSNVYKRFGELFPVGTEDRELAINKLLSIFMDHAQQKIYAPKSLMEAMSKAFGHGTDE